MTVGAGNDKLILRRFDLGAALDATGVDYLFVTSSPPRSAERGAAWRYPVEVRSRRGGVKYELTAAPDGMAVSPSGELKWDVPAGFNGTEAPVVLLIRDASGREVYHSFKVRSPGKAGA